MLSPQLPNRALNHCHQRIDLVSDKLVIECSRRDRCCWLRGFDLRRPIFGEHGWDSTATYGADHPEWCRIADRRFAIGAIHIAIFVLWLCGITWHNHDHGQFAERNSFPTRIDFFGRPKFYLVVDLFLLIIRDL